MGHYCRVCGRTRANEKFSGKGHRNHICKDCSRIPRSELDRVSTKEELWGFLNRQSHISKKNVKRLQDLMQSDDEEIRDVAGIVFEVAKITPFKKRRLKNLAKANKELLKRLLDSELVYEEYFEESDVMEERYDYDFSEEDIPF